MLVDDKSNKGCSSTISLTRGGGRRRDQKGQAELSPNKHRRTKHDVAKHGKARPLCRSQTPFHSSPLDLSLARALAWRATDEDRTLDLLLTISLSFSLVFFSLSLTDADEPTNKEPPATTATKTQGLNSRQLTTLRRLCAQHNDRLLRRLSL